MTKTFLERYFEAPDWGFSYMLTSKINEDIDILDMQIQENGDIELPFSIWVTIGRSGEPDEQWESPHFSWNRKFTGTIICKDVKELIHTSEPKGKGAHITITKSLFSKYKKVMIVDAESKEAIDIIVCKKLYIKDNDISAEKK